MASLFSYPKFHGEDSSGDPLVGGKLYTYAPGTTTPKASYTTAAMTVPNANPVILNSNGDAVVYLDGLYDVVLKNSAGVTQWSMSSVNGVNAYTSYEVDALNDYGSGTSYTQATIEAALTAIGTVNKVTLLLRPGNWVILTALAFPANVEVKMPAGAYFSGAGMSLITISSGQEIYAEWFYSGTGSWSTAIQAAINSIAATGGVIKGLAKTYAFTTTVNLSPSVNIEGVSLNATIYDFTGGTGFAFQIIQPNGTTSRQAPHFKKFKLIAKNGIKFNDKTNGFTDDATSQEFLMRALIEDCWLYGIDSTGIGVQWSKTFDSHILRSYINSYDQPIDWHGCDISSIEQNRITGGTKQISINGDVAIDYGTFGSQTSIRHNDILSVATGGYCVYSADKILSVEYNYFEEPTNTAAAIIRILNGNYRSYINNNRVDVRSTNWLVVDNVVPYYLGVKGNVTGNITILGDPLFSSAGVLYFGQEGNQRNFIEYAGNSKGDAGFPYNSKNMVYDIPAAAMFSPDLPGLAAADYGVSVLVKDRSFLLPALAAEASAIKFGPEITLAGTVSVWILAKASVGAQSLAIQWLNDVTLVGNSTQALTTSYAYYKIWTSIVPTNLILRFFNDDTVHGGDVYLRKVVVNYD